MAFVCMNLLSEGETDVSEHFSLSMEVFPSTLNHNGILFSVGSKPNFEYYEWKTAAVNTQFIVVEFIFSAVSPQRTSYSCNKTHIVTHFLWFYVITPWGLGFGGLIHAQRSGEAHLPHPSTS